MPEGNPQGYRRGDPRRELYEAGLSSDYPYPVGSSATEEELLASLAMEQYGPYYQGAYAPEPRASIRPESRGQDLYGDIHALDTFAPSSVEPDFSAYRRGNLGGMSFPNWSWEQPFTGAEHQRLFRSRPVPGLDTFAPSFEPDPFIGITPSPVMGSQPDDLTMFEPDPFMGSQPGDYLGRIPSPRRETSIPRFTSTLGEEEFEDFPLLKDPMTPPIDTARELGPSSKGPMIPHGFSPTGDIPGSLDFQFEQEPTYDERDSLDELISRGRKRRLQGIPGDQFEPEPTYEDETVTDQVATPGDDQASNEDYEQFAEAIYRSEGGERAKIPYGMFTEVLERKYDAGEEISKDEVRPDVIASIKRHVNLWNKNETRNIPNVEARKLSNANPNFVPAFKDGKWNPDFLKWYGEIYAPSHPANTGLTKAEKKKNPNWLKNVMKWTSVLGIDSPEKMGFLVSSIKKGNVGIEVRNELDRDTSYDKTPYRVQRAWQEYLEKHAGSSVAKEEASSIWDSVRAFMGRAGGFIRNFATKDFQ